MSGGATESECARWSLHMILIFRVCPLFLIGFFFHLKNKILVQFKCSGYFHNHFDYNRLFEIKNTSFLHAGKVPFLSHM